MALVIFSCQVILLSHMPIRVTNHVTINKPVVQLAILSNETEYSVFLPSIRSVRHVRCDHLHGDESQMGSCEWIIWFCLHPGLGGFSSGAHQRLNLRHLEETGMNRAPPWGLASRHQEHLKRLLHLQTSLNSPYLIIQYNYDIIPKKKKKITTMKRHNNQYGHCLKMYIVSMV